MPWDQMTDEQLEEFLDEKPKLEELPGVLYVQPELLRDRHRQLVMAVYVAGRDERLLQQLPTTLAGVPVWAIIEDPRTGEVLEVVDVGAGVDT